MALRIQKRSWKVDGGVTESWRLIVVDYVNGKEECSYPSKEKYRQYGIDPNSSYRDARDTLKVIQARNKASRAMVRKARIHALKEKELAQESAYLPGNIYRKFLVWLKDQRLWDKVPDKTDSHLRCMRDIVVKLNLDPSHWPDKPEKIYRYFLTRKLSLSYIEKVLPLLNSYGYFYCRELHKPFLPISAPSGDMARRIDDANHDERQGKQSASKPLAPDQLKDLAGLPPDQIRWIRVSIYFGLRPIEVDRLTEKSFNSETGWKVTQDSKKTWILHIYQNKLVKIERARRWKRIPCILPEQKELIQELTKGLPRRRPYAKTIQSYLGAGYGLYGGRKAFEKLMRSHGQDERNVSRWLGHTDINRTERNYRELEAVGYDPI